MRLRAGRMACAANGKPHPQNQTKLLAAIVEYFCDHPAPTFETIAQLDPQRIAAELNERATAIATAAGEADASPQTLDRARRNLVSATEEQLGAALGLLGL